ncbi:MAG: type III secretion system stator protein SctL [Acidobacteria bacterium]|nr:type III secretion system stator protein SctL [Acidobacteriota bacterium]
MASEDKIIKSSVAAPELGVKKVLKAEVFSASQEADELRAAARRDAQAIIDRSYEEAKKILETCRHQGYEEGLKQWNQAVAAAYAAHEKMLQDSEPELVKLALRIAKKIVGDQLLSDPETIVGIVREALKSVGREKSLTIRVHPEHLPVLRARIADLQEAVGASREIQIVESGLVARGGCIVESELGKIDAQLETQLKCLEDLLVKGAHA